MNVGTQRAIAVQCAFRTPAPFRVVCCVPALLRLPVYGVEI